MSTRSKTRSAISPTRLPVIGRLHEMAVTRPAPAPAAPQGWGQGPRLAGEALTGTQQITVPDYGRNSTPDLLAGGGRLTLAEQLYLEALRHPERPVVVLDKPGVVEAVSEVIPGLGRRGAAPMVIGTHRASDLVAWSSDRDGR